MRIAIFGGTGLTGRQLIEQALNSGHEVITLARQAQRVEHKDKALTIIQGDVLNQSQVNEVVKEADLVLSALGVRKLGSSNVVSQGTRNIVKAMETHKIKRLICITAVGIGNSRPQAKTMGLLFNRFLLPVLLAKPFADKELQEQTIKGSSLEWTIVRPASLTNGPLTKHYKVTNHLDFAIAGKISRADVAHFMLNQANTKANVNQVLTLSY